MDSQLIEIYLKNKSVQVSFTEHKSQNSSIEANDKQETSNIGCQRDNMCVISRPTKISNYST